MHDAPLGHMLLLKLTACYMDCQRISTMLIRPAKLADAGAIGIVHVKVWNETYRGIMPDSLLDRLNADERAKAWAARIPTFRANRQALMVADNAGEVVGFAGCGPRRSEKLPSDGEIYMINILSRAKRHHTGTRLMIATADALESNGFHGAGLWVLEKNLPARAFYERLGGTPGNIEQNEHEGVMLSDLAILWPRIATLKERATEILSVHRAH
jgi:ribosomal protein S18 acetylase RimI-like enzyme